MINESYPDYFPAMIGAGHGGYSSQSFYDRMDIILDANPGAKYYAIVLGTNDAGSDPYDFKSRMQYIIDRIQTIGAVPILATTFYARDAYHQGYVGDYAAKCLELTAENNLIPGPDFHTIFEEHVNEYFYDDLHPNEAGEIAIHRAWADAAIAAGLYGTMVNQPFLLTGKNLHLSGLTFTPVTNGRVALEVFSLNGQLVFSLSEMAQAGQKLSLDYKLSAQSLSQAMYLLKVIGAGLNLTDTYIQP